MTLRPDAPRLLRDARERFGVSQRELATAMKTSQARISAVESGRETPTAAWMTAAALAIGTEPDTLGVVVHDTATVSRDTATVSKNGKPDLTPPAFDPSGLTITLVIDRVGGRDDPCRLAARDPADVEAMARLGLPDRIDARGVHFNQLLVCASNRRVDVLIRYDRRHLGWTPGPEGEAPSKAGRKRGKGR